MPTVLLGVALAELRQQFNYSQQEIANYLTLSREAYSHYERGVREPSLETLVKLSKLYNIDISTLINEETILSFSTDEKKQVETHDSMSMVTSSSPFSIPSTFITSNIKHFLKLFTGKNSSIDFTDISKEDMAVLAQYKKLNKQSQKEVRQFIKFKQQIDK